MRCEVEWSVRQHTDEPPRVGSIILGKPQALWLFDQLRYSFGAARSPEQSKLTWGTQRLTWDSPCRNYWVRITVL